MPFSYRYATINKLICCTVDSVKPGSVEMCDKALKSPINFNVEMDIAT